MLRDEPPLETQHSAIRWIQARWGWIVGLYWFALFIATHLPPEQAPSVGGQDKHYHLGAYFVLGVLLAVQARCGGRLDLVRAGQLWLLTALYAVCDELLQAPVGRHPDVADGIADVIGSALGILIVLACGLIRKPPQTN